MDVVGEEFRTVAASMPSAWDAMVALVMGICLLGCLAGEIMHGFLELISRLI